MCGRTVLVDPHGIVAWFDIHDGPEMAPRYNIAPTQPIPVIRAPHRLELLRWGIPREGRGGPQINLRVEQILRTANKQRRCLVATDGFFEWKRSAGAKHGQPYLIQDQDRHPLGMAGVWSKTTTRDGEVLESVAIITCAPWPPVDFVHDRMPLIIPHADYARWIDPAADVTDLLEPASTRLALTPVSTYVNSPANDGPQAIEPAALQPTQGGLF